MLEVSLRVLERSALTSRSMTMEEAALRGREADQIISFIDRARQVEPKGQVVLAGRESVTDTLLEDGDVLVIPERSSIVMVHGEVTHPIAISYDSRSTVDDYVDLAGGTSEDCNSNGVPDECEADPGCLCDLNGVCDTGASKSRRPEHKVSPPTER